MNRADLLAFEMFYGARLRSEAKKRGRRSLRVAEQMTRWADASDARADAIRCGPLFDGEKT